MAAILFHDFCARKFFFQCERNKHFFHDVSGRESIKHTFFQNKSEANYFGEKKMKTNLFPNMFKPRIEIKWLLPT